MRPVKSMVPLAKWLLRIAAAAFVYLNFFNRAIDFSFNNLSYFLALAFVILVILLVVGGFMKTAKMTVISGLLIWIVCLIQLFGVNGFSLDNLLAIFPLTAIGFYFMARGNLG